MRRALSAIAGFAVVALAALSLAAGGDDSPSYSIELDNAFGLTVGSDLKVAGVRAGKIKKIELDKKSRHAIVDFSVTRTGFGSLRKDVTCETRPQSLIGEYFLTCQPGTASEELEPGDRIPIERTATTIPLDLVNEVMRRPYRERFRIILSQLGAGLAGRGEALNAALRRASPGLRETNRVLAILAQQNQTLKQLIGDADTVLADLSDNRRDVNRWVRETHETAAASAERSSEIALSLERFPAFLRELRPTMAELGRAADSQEPSLRNLSASADGLERLFDNLAPFSRSSRVNFRSLGEVARVGRPAVRAARPVVAALDEFSVDTPELAKNLNIVLSDLDDRGRAYEKDPRSPGGEGYTGFEALLQYVYDQVLSINIFDDNGYILKANLFEGECSEYQNAETLHEHMKEDPGFYERCASITGPNQAGVLQPDPTAGTVRSQARSKKRRGDRDGDRDAKPEATPAPAGTPDRDTSKPGGGDKNDDGPRPVPLLDKLLGDKLPPLPTDTLPQAPAVDPSDLLDFLLAP